LPYLGENSATSKHVINETNRDSSERGPLTI